ncbi:MAG: molecular chaperone HtpG [Proteobacteria bacterium]|nr:molecular chaperone HtpG [Pseudomonadota bacterium]MBU1611948.1 molecular chaperone HtpG [Pseudomonadota bacterium]
MTAKKSYKFKAEIKELLDILVHSLYTHKEIFLRELVSNASDALDKYRWKTTAEDNDGPDLDIRISADKEAGVLTITDTGIGMTREELIQNIGTIAHSGSAEFVKALAQNKEGDSGVEGLIGRFGVGFYSVYMVADEVTVTTRSADSETACAWTSDGQGSYTITDLPGDTPRGTSLAVKLKSDLSDEFTDLDALKRIIKKHSNFIAHPIFVGEDRVNTVTALWREPKFQVKKEQYNEFYQFLTYDTDEPLATIHTSVDAPVQFNALVFLGKHSRDPFGMGRDDWGLDLYVRRVLIQKQNKDLVPEWLSFAKGVVDTEDLPLNISRETLQDNLLIRKIRTSLIKTILAELTTMAENDKDAYNLFWDAHAELFKGGCQDYLHREKLAPLLRFNSSIHEDHLELTSFDDYIARAKPDQKEIYFLFGPSREACKLSPHVEIFRKKGVEVLFLYEPVDEFIMDGLKEYKEFKLISAEHADTASLDKYASAESDKEQAPELGDEEKSALDALLGKMQDALGEKVTQVRLSSRLSDSPVCLANPDGHTTSSMDKIMRVMTKDQSIPTKVLEINPDHPLIRNLIQVYQADADDAFIPRAATQLYESALLLEGYLTDPHALVGRIQELLTDSSGWYVQTKK